eukprot:354463-Chlamydomonas_euryale.AAC.9
MPWGAPSHLPSSPPPSRQGLFFPGPPVRVSRALRATRGTSKSAAPLLVLSSLPVDKDPSCLVLPSQPGGLP